MLDHEESTLMNLIIDRYFTGTLVTSAPKVYPMLCSGLNCCKVCCGLSYLPLCLLVNDADIRRSIKFETDPTAVDFRISNLNSLPEVLYLYLKPVLTQSLEKETVLRIVYGAAIPTRRCWTSTAHRPERECFQPNCFRLIANTAVDEDAAFIIIVCVV